MLQLIYASAATVEFSVSDLRELLSLARQNNALLGISGMLVFHEGSFLQVLEGEEEAVQSLYEKIEKDQRHTNVKMLLRSEVEEPSFGDWKMGFFDASGGAGEEDAGYVDFFRKENTFAETDEDRARKALLQFREGSWRQRVDID